MKLVFKQRIFSWFDSYDIYDENGNVYFTVKGQLAWGHMFKIYNKNNEEIGKLKQKIFTFLPKYEIYVNNELQGEIVKEFTFFKPKFHVTFGGITVTGDFFNWDYDVFRNDTRIATINKEIFRFRDTYTINVNESDALLVLMIVLSIDSIKDRQSSNNQ